MRALPNGLRREDVAAAILSWAEERGVDRNFSATDIAIALAGPDETVWRLLMDTIKSEAARLAVEGRVRIIRKGRTIAPDAIRGVYRIALAGRETR
jgi:hypothetical protein